jgi:hypothetical protein
LDANSESYWISFSNDQNVSTRIAINPFGAHRVQFFNNSVEVQSNVQQGVDAVHCDYKSNCASWNCHLNLDWSILPANVTHFQAVHVSTSGEAPQFIASCPGNLSQDPVDFRGCQLDGRSVIPREINYQYSDVWKNAVEEHNNNQEAPKRQ